MTNPTHSSVLAPVAWTTLTAFQSKDCYSFAYSRAAAIRNGGVMDAVGRLREKAQNEATCIALNNECRLLRQQLAECKSKWEHFENSVAEKSMQCLSLEKELAECQKDGKHYAHEYLIAKDALAECQRERDELKTWLEDQVCEAKDFAYKLEGKTVELATVIKERDELVVALGRIASSRVVDIAQAALAKLGADKAGEK